MGNKYTWVAFNLVASIGCLIFLLANDIPKQMDFYFSLFIIALHVGTAYWIYRSIIYWRKCIQQDDPSFNTVVDEMAHQRESE